MALDTVHAFLRDHLQEILRSWEELVVAEVRRIDLGGLALRDSIPEFLDELADWLESGAPPGGQKLGAQSLKHVIARLDQGFDLAQVMREYRLLREAILRRVLEAEQGEQERAVSKSAPKQEKRIVELARLNAGLDVAISGSIEDFVAERDRRAAVERKRAEEAVSSIRRHADEVNGFRVRFSDEVEGLSDPRAVANTACRMLREALGAERAYWAEVDWGTREYVVGAGYDGPDAPAIEGRFPLDVWEPFTSYHLAGRPVVVDDTQRDPRLPPAVRESYGRLGVGADLAAAAVVGGKLRATLAVNQRLPRRWTAEEAALVQEVAGRCWAAVERARAEEALRDKEARYRAVIDGMGEAFGLLDRELRIITQNEAALRLDGRPLDAIVGRTHAEVYPNASPELVALYHRALAEGVPVSLEHCYDWQGTVKRWLEMRAFPVTEGPAVFWRDISHRKVAEAALREVTQRLTVATEAARLGIHDYDVASGVIRWDARVREFWGVGPDEPVSYETFVAGLHPDDRVATEAAVKRALDPSGEGRFEAEYRVLSRADGRQRWIAATGQVTFEGGCAARLVGTVQDITERKKAEEALREADRRKNEFLAVLSHELRNPLAPLRNSIYLLDRAAPGTEPFLRARNVIERQTNHLARLVDDLLDVVRISRGRVELKRERVELRELVRQAMDAVRPAFAEAGIELRVEHPLGPTWLDADPTRIAQVVGNLLHNAHKFTPAGGTVTVRLDSDSGKAYLRVKDTGVGMEPGREQEMFEAFAQGDQGLARTKGGLGLGLALVKLFVEMHGGSVSATSEGQGRGTEFVLTLPLATTPAPQIESGERGNVRARRVLVIEDNADGAQTLADVLALDGHVVRIARGGVEGVAMAREHLPDVILCDIGLPDLDGYEVARQVRALPGLQRVRLVALTGYAQQEDLDRAKQAGFDAHLAKPPNPEVLARAVSSES